MKFLEVGFFEKSTFCLFKISARMKKSLNLWSLNSATTLRSKWNLFTFMMLLMMIYSSSLLYPVRLINRGNEKTPIFPSWKMTKIGKKYNLLLDFFLFLFLTFQINSIDIKCQPEISVVGSNFSWVLLATFTDQKVFLIVMKVKEACKLQINISIGMYKSKNF